MDRIEFNPANRYVCCECGTVAADEPVYRLNPDEVICLRDWVEYCAWAWSARMYDQRATR
jgi:hypothetical protein